MSRKVRHTARAVPVTRTRPAAHRRRRRGIRGLRPPKPIVRPSVKPPAIRIPIQQLRLFSIHWVQPVSALLLGMAGSLAVLGMAAALPPAIASPFSSLPPSPNIVLLAVVLALAAGLFLSRLTSRGQAPGWKGWPVAWGMLLSGLAMAMMPHSISLTRAISAWMHSHFVVSDLPVWVLQLAFALTVCLIPFAGIASAGAHLHRDLRRNHVPAFLLVVGASVGILAGVSLSAHAHTALLVASLPLLVLAVIAIHHPNRGDESPLPALNPVVS